MKYALFGAGKIGQELFISEKEKRFSYVFDNNPSKQGQYLGECEILDPDQVEDWTDIYVIIGIEDWSAVAKQLETYGLKYETNYVEYHKLAYARLGNKQLQEAIADTFLENGYLEIEERVDNQKDYEKMQDIYSKAFAYHDVLRNIYGKKLFSRGIYYGYCDVCKKEIPFEVGKVIGRFSWRETAKDVECGCNARIRYTYSYIEKHFSGKKIYMYEQITRLYKLVANMKDVTVIGSEFVSSDLKSGDVVDGLRHEDARCLSFDNESFDGIVSCDVYEHVPDIISTLNEAYRVLKPGGILYIAVPLQTDRYNTVKRAEMDENGNLEYLQPPVYHGNPMSDDGSLVFYDYGWDILDMLKKAGFSEVNMILIYSSKKCYVGNGTFLNAIEAKK